MARSRLLNRYRRDERGATAIEYGLLAAMIGIFVVGIMSTGGAVDEIYETLVTIGDAMSDASGGGGGGT